MLTGPLKLRKSVLVIKCQSQFQLSLSFGFGGSLHLDCFLPSFCSLDSFSMVHLFSLSSWRSLSVVGLGMGSRSKLCFLGSRGSSLLGKFPHFLAMTLGVVEKVLTTMRGIAPQLRLRVSISGCLHLLNKCNRFVVVVLV